MAPSATATATVTDPVNLPVNNLRLYADGSGDYKELSPTTYDKDAEAKGGDGHQGAKVSTASRAHQVVLDWKKD